MEGISGQEPKPLFWAKESTIPMRSEPSESSEMINQLVFGDFCRLIEDRGNWIKIKHTYDGYEGWVDRKMLENIPNSTWDDTVEWRMAVFAAIQWEDGGIQRLPTGAFIPIRQEADSLMLGVGAGKGKIVKGSNLLSQQVRPKLIEVSKLFMYTPYLWGGCSGFGIDCSGFMQRVFRACGLFIPRDSGAQAKEGETIEWQDRKEGDLIFLKKPNQSRITHVGLLRGDDMIIHASGRVRVDQLTEEGIYHSHHHKLSYHLVTIKRC